MLDHEVEASAEEGLGKAAHLPWPL
jgi:hypothetical protein